MSANLYVQESFVNASEGSRFGDSDVYETFTDDIGELYHAMQAEYGRCIGRVYVDSLSGPLAVGWVFVKRMQYEDARCPEDTYLREVWVTVRDAPDTVTREHHYHALTRDRASH